MARGTKPTPEKEDPEDLHGFVVGSGLPSGATRAGLPNSCCSCGKDSLPYWFAPSDDAALAGQGLCEDCHGVQLRSGEHGQSNTAD